MSSRMQRAAAVAACAAMLSSCAAWEQQSRTTKGAVYGGAAGAAAGSAIGAIAGGGSGAWKGAAIGAAVGAVGGGLMGNYMDKQAEEMQAVVGENDRLRKEQETIYLSLGSDVLFDSGKATLQPGGRSKLRELANILDRYPRTIVTITGNTDSRGSDALNDRLSKERAQAVADALVADGVNPARVATSGVGASNPVATNATPEGRQQNRRVDIVVKPDGSQESAQPAPGSAPAPSGGEEPK
ncbi:MAG TPA: OmpA family protein [Candidatus Dormibacteraeota bacterium]|nr:OmpA family protein [Candidatus Dormibacteraeota bacterium]